MQFRLTWRSTADAGLLEATTELEVLDGYLRRQLATTTNVIIRADRGREITLQELVRSVSHRQKHGGG